MTSDFGLVPDKNKVKTNDIVGFVDSGDMMATLIKGGLFIVRSSHYVAQFLVRKHLFNLLLIFLV